MNPPDTSAAAALQTQSKGTGARSVGVQRNATTWHEELEEVLLADDAIVTHGVVLRADDAWSLDADRQLVPVRDCVAPPWPAGSFAIVRVDGQFWQVSFRPPGPIVLRLREGKLRVTLIMRDKSRCGLRMWGDHKLTAESSKLHVQITADRLAHPEEAIWLEPFPRGARAAICLTDHPDWDSIEKLDALGELFAEHGVRITKGAFPAADPGWTQYGPGLDDPAYAARIRAWHECGHEIAYHGLGSGNSIEGWDLAACRRRLDALAPYSPESWIDHGSGKYGFARSATLPEGGDLVAELAQRGVRNFWSYWDSWQNPGRHLDSWKSRTPTEGFLDMARLAGRRGVMGPGQLAYLATIGVKNWSGPRNYRNVLRRPWSLAAWQAFWRDLRPIREIAADPIVLYTRHGDWAMHDPAGAWVFDTVLLNHLALQLHSDPVDQLARDGGMLIGHTYLGAVHRKGGRNCFDVNNPMRLLDGFREAIAHIGDLQRQDRLVTLPFRDLRRALVEHSAARIVRQEHGWTAFGAGRIYSHRPFRIEGRAAAVYPGGLHGADVAGPTTTLQV